VLDLLNIVQSPYEGLNVTVSKMEIFFLDHSNIIYWMPDTSNPGLLDIDHRLNHWSTVASL